MTRRDFPTTLQDVCDLNFALGEEFTRTVLASGVDISSVDIIASHGQTLWHTPDGKRKSTLQMAEPAVLAHRTKKYLVSLSFLPCSLANSFRTVVSDFRVAEIAAGRQGAPLSGFFEAGLLSHPRLTRVSQNIGGIGNATVVLAETSTSRCSETLDSNHFEFDTGPGNVLIDAAMRFLSSGEAHYDRDGEAGARGEDSINHDVVERALDSPYFKRQPPKTTGRELFSEDMARELVLELKSLGCSDDGIIATITRITAESIARAYEEFVIPRVGPLHEIYLCGGGAYNPNISGYLASRFPETRVCRMDEAGFGLNAAAKEAVLFAFLGFLSICGRYITVPWLNENRDPAILGKITPGQNYHDVLRGVVLDQSFSGSLPLGRISMKAKKE